MRRLVGGLKFPFLLVLSDGVSKTPANGTVVSFGLSVCQLEKRPPLLMTNTESSE